MIPLDLSLLRRFVASLFINSHRGVTWRYAPTAQNPADLGSRGNPLKETDQWWDGPSLLANPQNWPPDFLHKPSEESQSEAKLIRKVLTVAVDDENEVESVLRKLQLQKAVRVCVCVWMRGFTHSALRSRGKTRIEGPLTT